MQIDRKRKVRVRVTELDQLSMRDQELIHQYTTKIRRENRELREAASRAQGVHSKIGKLEQLYRQLLDDCAVGGIPMNAQVRYGWIMERVAMLERILDGGDKLPKGVHRNARYMHDLRQALGMNTPNPFTDFISAARDARFTPTGRRR